MSSVYKSKYTGEEIDSILDNAQYTPLHYNHAVTLKYASFDTMVGYRNSFSLSSFSRTPKVGDVFTLICIDGKQNRVFAIAKVTELPNASGYVPFVIEQAMLLYSAEEIANLKESTLGLKTEEWTFIVEKEDGSTEPVTKKVLVQ